MRNLSKPSKVASILDWKKAFNHTVLAVNFHKNRVGIAVASHPSLGVPCMELEPLRFEDHHGNHKSIAGAIDRKCLERFSDIIEEYKVCGVVVNWPLQRDTGRMGAACGRVVFALEQLWERSNETITADPSLDASSTHEVHSSISEGGGILSRPFCLWDAGHINQSDPSMRIDAFGRCASYGKEKQSSSPKPPTAANEAPSNADRYFDKEKNYFASKEQYYEDELTVVLGVWDDFCKEHWPDLCANKKEEDGEENNAGPFTLYSNLRPAATETASRLQDIKDKKSLITMR